MFVHERKEEIPTNVKAMSGHNYSENILDRCTHTSCTPSKEFKKFGHKNAIKHENRGTHNIFSQPQVPTKKNLKTTVHLCRKLFRESVVKR